MTPQEADTYLRSITSDSEVETAVMIIEGTDGESLVIGSTDDVAEIITILFKALAAIGDVVGFEAQLLHGDGSTTTAADGDAGMQSTYPQEKH